MSIFEQLVLDSLALNDRTNFILQGFDPGIAPKRWQWISGTDSDGAVLPEEAHYDNAEMTLRIRIAPQTSMDNALTKIGQIVDKLQECEQQPLGLACVWTPNNSTKSLTAYVLGGEVTGIPQSMSGDDAGWFLRNPAPVVTLKLYRRPFWYGTEVTSAATVTNTNPLQTLTVSSVTGDVPAEARLVLTDAATQNRRYAEWGLEWRYYNAATSLQINSSSLVTTGFGGVSTTRSGSVNVNVIRGTLTTSAIAICGVGNLSHVGTFRVKARVYASNSLASATSVRFVWKEGDGPLSANTPVSPAVGAAWSMVDLGTISIPEAILGTQRWTGQVEAYSTTVGDALDIDYILLIPTSGGYGRARAGTPSLSPTALNARDEFTGTTAGNALNARVAPTGGTWATSGAATDYTFADAPGSAETITRATTADGSSRLAVLGATNYTDTEVGMRFYFTSMVGQTQRIIARYVDTSNMVQALATPSAGLFDVIGIVGGSIVETYEATSIPYAVNTWYRVRLIVYAGGVIRALLTDDSGVVLADLSAASSNVATGGALATGKPGISDANTSASACTRYYDDFYVATPAAEPIVLYSGRSAEIRYDKVQRQDSTGTYYGDVPSYRGAHFFLPPAGDESRVSRIAAYARRKDIEAAIDEGTGDSTTWTVHYRPRWLSPPR